MLAETMESHLVAALAAAAPWPGSNCTPGRSWIGFNGIRKFVGRFLVLARHGQSAAIFQQNLAVRGLQLERAFQFRKRALYVMLLAQQGAQLNSCAHVTAVERDGGFEPALRLVPLAHLRV